jgi:uncharacterized protein YndB with AHSA1/START domain
MRTNAPFVISRVFRAPRPLVFDVYTQPHHLAQWLSPEGFHNIHTHMDFRVGERHHYGIQGPGGMAVGFGGTFVNLDTYLQKLQT